MRRGSQTVLFEMTVVLTKLMAPILSFTAEEIWRTLPEPARTEVGRRSVHLTAVPQADPNWMDAKLAERWDELLKVRSWVQAKLEEKRREKIIGSSLEAKVRISAPSERYEFLKLYEPDLPSTFIVSQVELRRDDQLEQIPDFAVEVEKATGNKCERCWNYRPAVGTVKSHPTLCDRCVEAVQ